MISAIWTLGAAERGRCRRGRCRRGRARCPGLAGSCGAGRARSPTPGASLAGQPGDTRTARSATPPGRAAAAICISSGPGRRKLPRRLADTFLQGRGERLGARHFQQPAFLRDNTISCFLWQQGQMCVWWVWTQTIVLVRIFSFKWQPSAMLRKQRNVLQRPKAKVLSVSHSLGVSGQGKPRLGYRWVTFSSTEAASGFADLSLESKVVQQEHILGNHTIKLMWY